MKRTMLILLTLTWAFSNPSLAAKEYDFSDEQGCEIISRFSAQLQHLSLLMVVRLDKMMEDEKDNTDLFAHSAREYLALVSTLEKAGDMRKSLKKEIKRRCN